MLEIGIIGRAPTADEVGNAQSREIAFRMAKAAGRVWSASARSLRPAGMATAADFSAASFGDPDLLG